MQPSTQIQEPAEVKLPSPTKTIQKIQKNHNIKKLKKYPSNSSEKSTDIVYPAISPMPTMNIFQFPMTPLTPSTTPSILSAKFNSNYFNFPEELSLIENSYIINETDADLDMFKSEQGTPKYLFPHYSPKTTFQHYLTPRNSNQ